MPNTGVNCSFPIPFIISMFQAVIIYRSLFQTGTAGDFISTIGKYELALEHLVAVAKNYCMGSRQRKGT